MRQYTDNYKHTECIYEMNCIDMGPEGVLNTKYPASQKRVPL